MRAEKLIRKNHMIESIVADLIDEGSICTKFRAQSFVIPRRESDLKPSAATSDRDICQGMTLAWRV